jgi:large subunit ribosomal protein L5
MNLNMNIYDTEVQQKIAKRLQINNPMEIPRISKIVLNVGMGEAVVNKNSVEKAQQQLSTIAGQKAVVTKARKSISAFKIRQGLPIGVKVTLRGKKMDGFLKRIVYSILPRIRDFRGIKDQAVDQNGNLNLGFTEQTIFPEIDFDSIDRIRGLQVTVVTNARNYDRGRALFEEIGIPFEKK